MTGPDGPDGGSELDQPHDPGAPAASDVGRPRSQPATATATERPAWWLFIGIAATVIILDQLSKTWVFATISVGSAVHVVDDLLRFIHSRNDGALFGLFGSSAPVLAVASLVVIGLIVWYHARSGRNLLLSIALGLLLGGALGNLLDRIRHGYVIDWVDMGIGTLRFWTYNVGDAAITVAILLLLLTALWPGLASGPGRTEGRSDATDAQDAGTQTDG